MSCAHPGMKKKIEKIQIKFLEFRNEQAKNVSVETYFFISIFHQLYDDRLVYFHYV